jgi:hypothetical protein
MSLPTTTAECSLYISSQPYRAAATGLRADHIHGTDCVSECMRECSFDVATCRFECEAQCGPRPPSCEPGYQVCSGSFGHRTCCPETTNCCVYHEWPSLRELLVCCGAGKRCCDHGGCFDPRLQQCTAGGISDCPSDRAVCRGVCCEIGEVCTPEGCSAPERVCQGRRCAPGELCTLQGCCPPIRTTHSGNCCPPGQASDLIEDTCCRPGWNRTRLGCCAPGNCCETVPCPSGKYCCQNLWCCNDGDECTTDPDNPCRTPFT